MYRIVKETHPERADEYIVEVSLNLSHGDDEWVKESLYRRQASLEEAQARVADLIQIRDDAKLMIREVIEVFE